MKISGVIFPSSLCSVTVLFFLIWLLFASASYSQVGALCAGYDDGMCPPHSWISEIIGGVLIAIMFVGMIVGYALEAKLWAFFCCLIIIPLGLILDNFLLAVIISIFVVFPFFGGLFYKILRIDRSKSDVDTSRTPESDFSSKG
jgi:hypothetical protein